MYQTKSNDPIIGLLKWIQEARRETQITVKDLSNWEKKEIRKRLIWNIVSGNVEKGVKSLFLGPSSAFLEDCGLSNADANAIRVLLRGHIQDIPLAWAIWSNKRNRQREISLQGLAKALKEYESKPMESNHTTR